MWDLNKSYGLVASWHKKQFKVMNKHNQGNRISTKAYEGAEKREEKKILEKLWFTFGWEYGFLVDRDFYHSYTLHIEVHKHTHRCFNKLNTCKECILV